MATQSDIGVRENDSAPLLVIAHRGASHAYPENTLAAFAGAAALGAHWVEFDVRRLGDDTLVIHHDPVLPDGRVLIELTEADLPANVPTFSAAIDTCLGHGLGVNIEIKSDPEEPDFDPDYAVAHAVATAIATSSRLSDGHPRYLVTSFDRRCIDAVRDHDPSIETGQLAFHLPDQARTMSRTRERGHVAINPAAPFVDENFLREARAQALRVYPWTVDDPERMRELIDLGVDGIITNVPDVLRSVVDKLMGERG